MLRSVLSTSRAIPGHAASLLVPSLLLAACVSIEEPTVDELTVDSDESSAAEVAAPLLTTSNPTVPLAIRLSPLANPQFMNLTIPANAHTAGMWSSTKRWPLNGLHSTLLPNGQVLTYGTPANDAGTQEGRTYDVWSPSYGFAPGSHQTSYNATRPDSFCSTATFLPDGRLMLSGGNSQRDSTQFTTSTRTISAMSATMAADRWYATMITLPGGRPLIMGGSVPYDALWAFNDPDFDLVRVSITPEIYEPTGWRTLFGAASRVAFGPDFNRYWYPRAWVAPTGEVFGISTEKMWYLNVSGDGAVRDAGDFKTAPDDTTLPNVGPTSTAVMFAPGRILQVGGNGYNNEFVSRSSARATIIDINGASPVVSDTASMRHARQWANANVLPDGRVLITGGTRNSNNGGSDAVRAAELWNPNTGTWTTGASAAQIRVYHSAAILLADGTVLTTGGGAPGPVNNLNAEVYYPPYLFRAAGTGAELAPRPVINAISTSRADPGQTIEFDVTTTSAIRRVVLIGTSSVTHSFNTSQRFQQLDFVVDAQRVAAALPANANLAPPGYYHLVALNAAGVPSASVIIAVGSVAAPPATPRLLQPGSTIRLDSVGVSGRALATSAAGLGVLVVPTTTNTASLRFTVRQGLADPKCISLESAASPGRFLRHAAFRLMLNTNDGSDLFRNDATLCPEAGLAGRGVTFRSKNYAAMVLRRINNEVWIDSETTGSVFAADSSFLPVAMP
jgi:large repetitive protein